MRAPIKWFIGRGERMTMSNTKRPDKLIKSLNGVLNGHAGFDECTVCVTDLDVHNKTYRYTHFLGQFFADCAQFVNRKG